ncbi:MAG: hypothetical protein V7K97_18870 [Nostoc sp.]|uniref:hypothetical protein n=1 Tax=Nostoc sp. TaxID=1180 RepID=UPI002FF7D976
MIKKLGDFRERKYLCWRVSTLRPRSVHRFAQLSITQLVERTPSGILLRVASPRVVETNGGDLFL